MFAMFPFASLDSLRFSGQPIHARLFVHQVGHCLQKEGYAVGKAENIVDLNRTRESGRKAERYRLPYIRVLQATYRRLEVGADATEASAASPGSEWLTETDPKSSL